MKKDIHPKFEETTLTCECGAIFIAGSTIGKSFKTEICSNCHPFYTGKQKLVDSSGRVDKFVAKMKKAQEIAEKNVKKVKKGEGAKKAKETAIKEVVQEDKPVEEPKEEKKKEEKPKTKAAKKEESEEKSEKKAPSKKKKS